MHLFSRNTQVTLPILIAFSGLFLYFFLPAKTTDGLPSLPSQPALSAQDISTNEPITPIPLNLNLNPGKVALGDRLFHDTLLSIDNSISCAHCHNLKIGGMDNSVRSTGVDGFVTSVNTPTVFNSVFSASLFWDGRVATLEEQLHSPITLELGSTIPTIIAKLKMDDSYQRDFAAIYPEGIQEQSFIDALVTFEQSLITPNSAFDHFLRGDLKALNEDAQAGYSLFKNYGCISCHQGINVGGNMFERIGVIEDYFAFRGNVQKADYGRYNVTGDEHDRYEFRVPSLRNVALTAPYFHDGSAKDLDQAVTTMARFQLGVTLNNQERFQIVSFLNSLTGTYQNESFE
ncbi:MAG: cytochrome c peroxidase [Gallionella sp.]